MRPPALGIGLTYHTVLDRVIEKFPGLIQVLEIEPETHWLQPDHEKEAYTIDYATLEKIRSFPFKKLMHSIGFPVAGSRVADSIQYPLHNEMISILDVPWMSEHLSFNKAGHKGKDYITGFMLPQIQTTSGVEAAVKGILSMKENLPIPVAVETGVNYLRVDPNQIPDGKFIAAVTEKADCGILLDLHNLYTNQRNGRQTLREFISQIPLDRIWELHVAGGQMREGFYIDSHSGRIQEDLFETAEWLIPQLSNLGAIIFEVFPDYLDGIGEKAVQEDLERLNRYWDKRGKALQRPTIVNRQKVNEEIAYNPISPAEWEDALAALVTGQVDHTAIDELNTDPAIPMIKGLIQSFRASMISESFRYTARLLMIYLGVEKYEELLKEFWQQTTPEPFAPTEAENFLAFLSEKDTSEVVGLQEIIQFERAYIETLLDGVDRIVNFPFDPLSFLKAISEARKPHQIFYGNYELVLEADQGIANKAQFGHKAVAH